MRSRSAPRIALPSEPLVDGETTVRRWREDDAEEIAALCRDSAIVRWIGLSPDYGPADARVYIESTRGSARDGLAAGFAIAAVDGTPLGSVGLVRIAWPDRRAEVGYWLGAGARGHGHATRAVGLVCRWGFRELALERIDLLAATGNAASQAVAQRAGFAREAVLRAYGPGPDGREDFVCFGRLANDPG